jgi:hypothetical protein
MRAVGLTEIRLANPPDGSVSWTTREPRLSSWIALRRSSIDCSAKTANSLKETLWSSELSIERTLRVSGESAS